MYEYADWPNDDWFFFGAIPDYIIRLVQCGPKGYLDSLIFDNTNLFVDQRFLNTMLKKDIRSIINRSQISLPAYDTFLE